MKDYTKDLQSDDHDQSWAIGHLQFILHILLSPIKIIIISAEWILQGSLNRLVLRHSHSSRSRDFNQVAVPSFWRSTDTPSSGPWTPLENFLATSASSSASDLPRLLAFESSSYTGDFSSGTVLIRSRSRKETAIIAPWAINHDKMHKFVPTRMFNKCILLPSWICKTKPKINKLV